MSGRALLLVLLTWFVGSQLAAIPTLFLLHALPAARPLALPLQYVLHASLGIGLFAAAEGLRPGELLHRCLPRPKISTLLQGLGFFATAAASVFLVAILLGPFLPKDAQPQKELMELIGGSWGMLSVALLFLTVAGLAPFFEELLFRGALLGWLAPRMPGSRGPLLAVVISGLAFGAIHLQPAALPTLGTLGIILGWACLRTRSLWASILVHALWNGCVFAFTRLLV